MFPPIQPTKDRNSATQAFDTLRFRALTASVWAKLTQRPTLLAGLSGTSRPSANRKSLGVYEIPLAQVVGTLGRATDFDYQFRPLNTHLRERWVNVFISFSTETWPPILVHKIGENYYVEDGHHRISVARALGMAYMQAEVWEYSTQPATTKLSQTMRHCTTGCLQEACPA